MSAASIGGIGDQLNSQEFGGAYRAVDTLRLSGIGLMPAAGAGGNVDQRDLEAYWCCVQRG